MAKPLYEAINIKEVIKHCTEVEAKAFSDIKIALVSVPVLTVSFFLFVD